MTKEEVWNEYNTPRWIAENGLGRLDPYPESSLDGGAIDGNGQECVWNENGIYFRDIFHCLSKIAGIHHQPSLEPVIKKLESFTQPGTYNRRPYGTEASPRHEAHDNYLTIASSSVERAKDICQYGLEHGDNYNNVEGTWLLKQQRQNGERAFYATMAEYIPNLFDWCWLLVGLLVGAFNKAANETQLSWYRLYKLSKAKLQTSWQFWSLMIVGLLWKVIKSKTYPTLGDLAESYYKPGHPAILMAQFCGKRWGF